MTQVVLDASARLALLRGEPGAEKVAAALDGALLCAVNLAEVVSHYAKLGASRPDIEAVLQPLPVTVVSVNATLSYAAGMLRLVTPPGGLSLGDRYCLALVGHRGNRRCDCQPDPVRSHVRAHQFLDPATNRWRKTERETRTYSHTISDRATNLLIGQEILSHRTRQSVSRATPTRNLPVGAGLRRLAVAAERQAFRADGRPNDLCKNAGGSCNFAMENPLSSAMSLGSHLYFKKGCGEARPVVPPSLLLTLSATGTIARPK